MKFRLYVLKSLLPKGVPSGIGHPVGPVPVKLAFKVGATVKVDVYALSNVAIPAPVALCHTMFTVFFILSFGDAVMPSRVNGLWRVMFTCSV